MFGQRVRPSRVECLFLATSDAAISRASLEIDKIPTSENPQQCLEKAEAFSSHFDCSTRAAVSNAQTRPFGKPEKTHFTCPVFQSSSELFSVFLTRKGEMAIH